MIIVRLTNVERDRIVLALNVLGEEYQKISETTISDRLRRGFETDATEIHSLAGELAGLSELLTKEQLDRAARELMAASQKIEAIKLVRANTTMGLKEAKDCVEAL